MKQLLLLFFAVATLLLTNAAAAEIQFIEDFVLGEDREAVLSQLIPGTDDYYYYHALNEQHEENWAAYEDVIKAWSARLKQASRAEPGSMKELRNRAALLRFEQNPKAAWDRITSELDLRFNHTRQVVRKPTYPTELDPTGINTAAYKKEARRHNDYINRFTPWGLEQLQGDPLDPRQRRALLSRLERPDWPGLVDLIVLDLKYQNSRGYGSHKIHSKLTLPQLRALAEKHASVLFNPTYVNEVVKRLTPNADQLPTAGFEAELPDRIAALERLWDFVKDLSPVHNSLKLNILHERLRVDLQAGELSEARFMEYIKIPRNLAYMEPRWLQREEHRNRFANLNQDFPSPCLSPVRGDEGLLREYLERFFVDAKDFTKFAPYLRDSFLKEIFATTKILHGKGDVERWASMLNPASYKALKESVEINFRPENPRQLSAADPVVLKVDVKNVPELLVKIYEVNAFNYFREVGNPVNLAINLDGLVATSERRQTYDRQPEQRSTETFKFPQLKGRGVWVVEFIGNGVSSRALVQKGRLHAETRSTPAGHGILVRDEKQKLIKKASVWIGGRAFEADKNGLIIVPYSTSPGSAKLILRDGDFASLVSFPHKAETYALHCGVHVDHESLKGGQETDLLIRPVLSVNGVPISPELLKNARLSISSTDLQGTTSQRDVSPLKISAGEDLVVPFQVPYDLQNLTMTLSADVENVSANFRRDKLQASKNFAINHIDQGTVVHAILFTRRGADHFVEVRGLNGEAVPDRPLRLRLQHKWFVRPLDHTIQTDEKGVAKLGTLPNILSVQVEGDGLVSQVWRPAQPMLELPAAIHGFEQEAVPVALPASSTDELALFSLTTGEYAEDLSATLELKDGFVIIPALPGGDYELVLKTIPYAFPVRITAGERRRLEFVNPAPLQIAEIKPGEKTIDINLVNAGEHTRVHVFASWYNPAHAPFPNLHGASLPPPSVRALPSARSFYESGRDIGDEYRYILDRQDEPRFAGNLLTRPGLLLNPWEVRVTEATEQDAKAGGSYRVQREDLQELTEEKKDLEKLAATRAPQQRYDMFFGGGTAGKRIQAATGVFKNINFLAAGGVRLLNLKPDKDGVVSIALDALAGKPQIHVVAIDPLNTVYRSIALDEGAFELEDQRLKRPLDPAKGTAEQKLTTVAKPAEGETQEVVLRDARSAKFALFDSLTPAFDLLATMRGDTSLDAFRFLLSWPTLDEEAKRAKYSEFACHELHFFLYHKDRAFFDRVIKPYLANKKHKTFMDHWLLGANLERYTEPWTFQRLNHMEKILLAGRLPGRSEATARWIQHRTDMIAPDLEADNRRFRSALQSAALGGGSQSKKLMDLQNMVSFSGAMEEWKFEGGYNESGQYIGSGGLFNKQGDFIGDTGGYDDKGRFAGAKGYFNSQGNWYGPGGGYDQNGNFSGDGGMYDRSGKIVGLGKTAQGSAGIAPRSMSQLTAPATGVWRSAYAGAGNYPGPSSGAVPVPTAAPLPPPKPETAKASNRGIVLGDRLARANKDRSVLAVENNFSSLRRSERDESRRFFVKLDKTKEWAENNYYQLPIKQQLGGLIPVNRFWNDYAAHVAEFEADGDGLFLSGFLADAAANRTDALLALAVLDLPFASADDEALDAAELKDDDIVLNFKRPAILFHQEVRPTEEDPDAAPVLVAQNVFRADDRYRTEGNQRFDKFVRDEFLRGVVYGTQILLTNPTSAQQKLEVMVQIPRGAVPVKKGFQTRGMPFVLTPFGTQSFEYFFYFPESGEFAHFPVNVARDGKLVARAEPITFKVVDQPTDVDETSWAWISQNAETEALFDYLEDANLNRIDLERIAWRLKDKAVFERFVTLLADRLHYHHTAWQYAVYHKDVPRTASWLRHTPFPERCGLWLDTPLLELDPVARHQIEHLEYDPLVNRRAHRLGPRRHIANKALHPQYHQVLKVLRYRPELDDTDHLALAYYLAVQDRIGEAIGHFEAVDPGAVATKLQYDYMAAWLAISREDLAEAREFASAHLNHPVDKWRTKFEAMVAQLDEKIEEAADPEDRNESQDLFAGTEPVMQVRVIDREVQIDHSNLGGAEVNLYPMDIELLFSRNPFVKDQSAAFAFVKPAFTQKLPFAEEETRTRFAIPQKFRNRNLLVELVAGGVKDSAAVYANDLTVSPIEAYGQVQVLHQDTAKPLGKTYVKVYVKTDKGQVKFFKDGYTDFRGRFDYASLNSTAIDSAQRFSILVLHEEFGATIIETDPPKR